MNTEFNYYDYKKKKEFKYDIKIDLSGINLQADASISETDENGKISEVNLNETVDEYINHIYFTQSTSPISYIDTESKYYNDTQFRFDGQNVVEQELIDFETTDNPREITLGQGQQQITVPIKPRHELMKDGIITSDITINSATYSEWGNSNIPIITLEYGPNTIPVETFTTETSYQAAETISGHIGTNRIFVTIEGADNDNLNGEFPVSVINDVKTSINIRETDLGVNPTGNLGKITQYRVSFGGYKNRGHIVSRDIYSAFGLWDNNNYSTTNGLGKLNSKVAGAINKKYFYRNLQSLRDRLAPVGVEVVSNEYRRKVIGDSNLDINYSYLKRGAKFNNSLNASTAFLKDKNKRDNELLPLSSDEITPFTMSIKDAFAAQFDTADELSNEFINRINNLIDAIQDNPLVYSMIDTDSLTGSITIQNTSYTDEASKIADIDVNDRQSESSGKHHKRTRDQSKQGLYYNIYLTYFAEINGVNTEIFVRDKNDNKVLEKEILIDSSNINALIKIVSDLEDTVRNIQISAALLIATLSPATALAVNYSINKINDRFAEFDTTIKKIKWYQKYINQSVFDSGEMIYDKEKTFGNETIDSSDSGNRSYDGRISEPFFPYSHQYARMLIPVDFGTKKEKYKKKVFGTKLPITAYRIIDLGVHWVEVYFIDTNAYTKYKKNDTPSGNEFILNIPFTTLGTTDDNTIIQGTFETSLPDEIMDRNPENVIVTISGAPDDEFTGQYNGTYNATILDAFTIEYQVDEFPITNTVDGVKLDTMIVPLQPTKSDDDPRNIRVTYNMPSLPFDSELRDTVFNDFGPFDQSKYANKSRAGDYYIDMSGHIVEHDDIEGWEIFHQSSKEISSMRTGIDIYNKTQFLIKILESEFTESRVHVIETVRSFQDQEYLQLGGDVSSFLSWHNYGLAIKIKIVENDGITPIKDGSSDMLKLLNIAEAFCNGARNGEFGEPMNVVWCGQLVTGPDLFDWEFLPIGVNHKDAIKFRDSIYQQKDPIMEHSYVNVTKNGYLIGKNSDIPDSPYIREGSKGITEAISINNELWVHPKYIKNYQLPNNLILKDLQEFLSLIKGKMSGNGTTLVGRKKVDEWKAKNPKSFTQLVLFYGMIGSMSSARGLLAGDYIQTFQTLVNKYYEKNPIKFVKSYLGDDEYDNVKIYIEDLPDSSYIKLSDGTLTTPVLDARSTYPVGNGNTFGQKQIDFGSVEFGQYQDGVFIPEGDDRIITIQTDKPVIDGYDEDGIPFETDAILLHRLIANQLIDEFKSIVDLFNNLNIKFMHDKFNEGSNKGLADLLENEFGVIASQDIMTFDELREMYDRILINNRKSENDGTVRGAGANIEAQNENDGRNRNKNQSVFEKLISNSQLQGVRKVNLSREKPIIEELENGLKIEEVVKEIQNQRIPNIRDIL